MSASEAQPVTVESGLAAILGELRLHRRMLDDVWTADEIAAYFKLSKKSVQNHIINDKSFPQGKILPTGGRRWDSKEVTAWFAKR